MSTKRPHILKQTCIIFNMLNTESITIIVFTEREMKRRAKTWSHDKNFCLKTIIFILLDIILLFCIFIQSIWGFCRDLTRNFSQECLLKFHDQRSVIMQNTTSLWKLWNVKKRKFQRFCYSESAIQTFAMYGSWKKNQSN